MPSPRIPQKKDYSLSLRFQERTRTYQVHLPPQYRRGGSFPLVIVLHGGGGNASIIEWMTGFTQKADQEGFIVVYPNGTGKLPRNFLTWNGGNCCGYALENDIDDVGFIQALITKLTKQVSVDRRRIFITGISNGGKLAYNLACRLSDIIAAIAPVAGSLDIPDCRPQKPVSVIIFHGTADESLPYDGGLPKKIYDKRLRVDNSVASAVSFWKEQNGCGDFSRNERGSIVHDVYNQCRDGSALELYTIKNGGHAWPGGKKVSERGDEPTQEISATDVIWNFFKNHPKQ